jgi:hypothetical protein
MDDQLNPSDQEFIELNHRSIAKLRRKHPECMRTDIVRALRMAQRSMAHSSGDQIIAAASVLLENSPRAK